MKIACIGGGPAGLYFSILMKKQDPAHDIVVFERNAPGVTFGWGVVFSDETLGYLQDNDPETHQAITRSFAHWDAIDIHFRGETIRSGGHGFSGIARRELLSILEERARGLGVRLEHNREIEPEDAEALARENDLVLAGDGVRSKVRERWSEVFGPTVEDGACKFIWLGTTRTFDAFTFDFVETPHGWLQAHAYRFDATTSTFIVECRGETWRGLGFDRMPPEDSVRELERLFAKHLDGHPLLTNRSLWIQFPTVKNRTWRHGNIVIAGDAAHTAHFSIGSGTKLAMEDSIALAKALDGTADVKAALEAYEANRLPVVTRTQSAARESLAWFENVARYVHFDPLQFAFTLLTRSRKVSYENLKLRDPGFIARVAASYVAREAPRPVSPATPPMFVPFRLRGMEVANRVVVSPMCMYSANDGLIGDFHLVHLGSRAIGGAGLVFTEMTCVSRDARITPGCAGLYRPEHVAAWKRVVDFVHTYTPAKICLQLGHAGRKGSTRLLWEGMDEPLAEGGWPVLSASPIPYTPRNPLPREMDRADMDRVRDQFVAAARLGITAGFDMLELHMAHGYLLSSFLSPLTNHRRDTYGGTLANRLRFPLEVFEAVRAVWPEERPMSVRLSATDWAPGGLEGADAVAIARALGERGLDIADVSAGQVVAEQQPVYGRMFQTRFSDQVRNEAGLPTIAVGNISSADEVNSILAAGRADLVALARPHLADPYWTLHAAAQQAQWDHPWPVPYESGKPRPRAW